ncbi:MAG: NAD-dependent epimerase/dehydratase family protein [Rhodoferax sp.]|nr:NAD-dependent epimerase/dehydratase family protein [Rhodoferax sp.]
MIVGNGLLATAFAPRFASDRALTVFASGVANSRETRRAEFERERDLLQHTLQAAPVLVYFSTCSVHDPELSQSPYVQHKLAMEQLIHGAGLQHAIVRLPQAVGLSANPHTLTNYLYRQISAGERFQLWLQARRNLIDVTDVVAIVAHLVDARQIAGASLNVACPFSVLVLDIVRAFEALLGVSAVFDPVTAGADYPIDTTITQATAAHIGLVFDDHYLDKLLRKYYG